MNWLKRQLRREKEVKENGQLIQSENRSAAPDSQNFPLCNVEIYEILCADGTTDCVCINFRTEHPKRQQHTERLFDGFRMENEWRVNCGVERLRLSKFRAISTVICDV